MKQMREILFRGQTRKRGEIVRAGDRNALPSHWVYGGVLQGADSYSVIYGTEDQNNTSSEALEKWCVYSDTLGQFTGIKDISGNRIFEGDIVSFKRTNALGYTTSRIGEVKYFDELPVFYIMATTGDAWDWFQCENLLVIGNIHDNPELLKGCGHE